MQEQAKKQREEAMLKQKQAEQFYADLDKNIFALDLHKKVDPKGKEVPFTQGRPDDDDGIAAGEAYGMTPDGGDDEDDKSYDDKLADGAYDYGEAMA